MGKIQNIADIKNAMCKYLVKIDLPKGIYAKFHKN